MAQVQFENVTKRFEGTTAVSHLTLEAMDKEFLVLVGPSGCGKSTALRMLAGLEDVTEGRILIGGRDVTDLPPRDRNIAMVFQSYALYPHMSVFDNLAFGLTIRHVPKPVIREKVEEAARILNITELLRRRPAQLSGGQRQRVALGRAIVRDPAVFLMDEPLSNLDAKLRVQTRAELIKLHQRLEATIVYVTHDQVEAMTMGHRIAVMQAGMLQQVDTPEMLYQHPANVFVAGFLGSPPMNFLPVRVGQHNGGVDLTIQERTFPINGVWGPRLQPFSDKEIVLGVRPQYLQLANGSTGDGAVTLPARVDVVEYLGDELLVNFTAANAPLTAQLAPDAHIKAGDQTALTFPLGSAHFFDPATGQAIEDRTAPET